MRGTACRPKGYRSSFDASTELDPDRSEETDGAHDRNVVPGRGYRMLPVVGLDREIERMKGRVRETVEQYEASTEELKASNEELQSMNEELSTVNLELKSKVDELGHANSDLRNLMDATAIPTIFLDRQLRITRYTPAAVDVFNLVTSDTGRPLSDMRNELDYPTLDADAATVLDRLVPIEREISGAGEIWFLARLRPYRTLDDSTAGVVLTLVDITERRRTEERLRASEERLRLIIENAREYAIFTIELDGTITTWSSGAQRVFGHAEAEVVGKRWSLIWPDEDLAAGAPAREMRVALADGVAPDNRFHQRKDASRFWSSGSLMSMHDASGETVGFVKILRDETESRLQQQALEKGRTELLEALNVNETARCGSELQNEHLATLFEQMPLPICILRGADYRVEFANAPMCEVWGVARDAIADRPVFEAVADSRRLLVRRMLDDVVKSASVRIGREVVSRIDRRGTGNTEEVRLNFTYAPLRKVDGRIDGVLAVGSDVTEEIRQRDQMKELHEQARAAARAKDDFLALLGHELRNPLAPLRNSLQLMRAAGDGSIDTHRMLDVAERQAGNLARIVSDLIEGARLGEGRIELRLEHLDLGHTVREAVESTREFLEANRHEIELTLAPRPLHVNADPVRIGQIVVNLLNNAGKYTPAGGRITVCVEQIGDMAELRVADTGIGIPSELRPRLFQMFQQGDRELARQEGGLGIGLSVVRRLAELHHGSVDVRSEGPGRGSEFVVRLPLAAGVSTPPGSAEVSAAAERSARRRVLVVDDNVDAGETLQLLVETLGHESRFAADGPAALSLTESWVPEVVFLDIGLPGMDGYEVAREFRRRLTDPAPKLVAVTGYGQESDRQKAHAAGFDLHLVKPADFATIASVLREPDRLLNGEAVR